MVDEVTDIDPQATGHELEYQVPEHMNNESRWEYKLVSVWIENDDSRCKFITKMMNEGGWEPHMIQSYGDHPSKSQTTYKPSVLLILRRKVDYEEDSPNFGPSD